MFELVFKMLHCMYFIILREVLISEICILVEFDTNCWKGGRSRTHCVCYGRGKGHQWPWLGIHLVSASLPCALLWILLLDVHAIAIPCCLYKTDYFIWVSVPLALYSNFFSFLKCDKTELSLILRGHGELCSSIWVMSYRMYSTSINIIK